MAVLLTPTSMTSKFTPPNQAGPFYAETPETSKAFYKLATTPSPRAKKPRLTTRSHTPSPNDSRSLHNSKTEEEVNCVLSRGEARDVPSGLGLGLGLPVLPRDHERDPLNWRFSNITKPSTISEPSSPSPSDSVIGAGRRVDPDDYSVYTLTPGPAWPPPPSSTVSPDDTPRMSATREADDVSISPPMSPLTPAISQLLDEISTIPRPPDSTEDPAKTVTTVQAWVLDMPVVGRGRGRGKVEVRRMRSWRDLRAEGLRRHNFGPVPAMPSPPTTPPSVTPVNVIRPTVSTPSISTQLPPHMYEDDRIIISPPNDYEVEQQQQQHQHVKEDDGSDIDSDSCYDSDSDARSVEELLPRKTRELETLPVPAPIQKLAQGTPLVLQNSPDPDSDLVHEIEELLESSPLRKQEERELRQRDVALQRDDYESLANSSTLKPPSFNRLKTDDRADSIRTSSPDNEAFFTPREQSTPFFEKRNPFLKSTSSLNNTLPPFQMSDVPPVPVIATQSQQLVDRPQSPSRPPIPRKSTSRLRLQEAKQEVKQEILPQQDVPHDVGGQVLALLRVAPEVHKPTIRKVETTPPMSSIEIQHSPKPSPPTRPVIPQRRSSLSHSRNASTDSIHGVNYPPVSLPAVYINAHNRGKSIDSSSLYNRERSDKRYHSQKRQRSSSANAVGESNDDDNRGRGRSRSIDDGPPEIPSRTSSLGKTSKPAQILDQLAARLSVERQRPVLVRSASSRGTQETLGLRHQESNISIRESIEIFSSEEKAEIAEIAEVVSRSSSLRAQAKQVIVQRSPSQKQSEFEKTSNLPVEKPPMPSIPTFNFGPDIGPSATTNQNNSNADQHSLELPVVFQVIPPTPYLEDSSKQLGLQVPQLVHIPATPDPTSSAGDYLLVKPFHPSTPVPNSAVNGDNIFALSFDDNSQPDSFNNVLQSGLLIPPSEDKKSTPPPAAMMHQRTPQRLTDWDTAPPPVTRPKLKNRPTKLRQSKLHPWWRPTHPDDVFPSSSTPSSQHRPTTSSTVTTTISGGSGTGSDDAISLRKENVKRHRSIKLGKNIQVEFVGVRGLREQLKERKESKKRKDMVLKAVKS